MKNAYIFKNNKKDKFNKYTYLKKRKEKIIDSR